MMMMMMAYYIGQGKIANSLLGKLERNPPDLEPFEDSGLILQDFRSLLHVYPVCYAFKLVHTRRALSSTIVNQCQMQFNNHSTSQRNFNILDHCKAAVALTGIGAGRRLKR